ncbi:GNAT family N-acetyltransferase [Pseudopedobacter beijingensis]|uniref:GNAT family N-acetyltransferase n=1 Tax=Pseudopedobacter beijingensis TaxID=1207056 RepID=A0ABW4IFJ2_9SPHI
MVILQPFERKDFDRLIDWVNSEKDLVQFAGKLFEYPLTVAQLERYVGDRNRFAFKVIAQQNKEVIGHAEIYRESVEEARLCRILIGNPAYRGKGIGKAIVKELLDFALSNFNVEYIDLNVYNWNTSAIKCYENMGFKVNPLKTSTIVVGGEDWIALNMIYNPETTP